MSLATPHTRLFTRDEYHRMGEMGFFEGQRVQLIQGEVIHMSPQKSPHANGIGKVQYRLLDIFPAADYWVRVQMPLNLSEHSEPEPDVAVVAGRPGDASEHPRSALLVVEVSDTTLQLDRQRKAPLYAAAGVADYWVLNIPQRQLEVFRKLVDDPDAPLGHRYDEQRVLSPGDEVSPLAAGEHVIKVADLLP